MSKTLAVISAAGFLLCIVFFALAFLIAGDQVFNSEKPFAGIKPLIDMAGRKQWRWDGGDTLAVNAPMVLRYQAGGVPGVTVTGPADLLAHVQVGGGKIGADTGYQSGKEKLDAVVSGVPIRKFIAVGNQEMQLGHIDQDSLYVRLDGHGSVSADGRVDQLNLVMAGHGKADMGRLVARAVKVAMFGHGDATLAPGESLYATMVGHNVVRLTTRTASIRKTILGSGQIIEVDGNPPQPPAAPVATNEPSLPPPSPSTSADADRNFTVTGSSDADLGRLEQGSVRLMLSGSGSARAEGQVDRLTVTVAGSGNAKLGGLSVRRANVTIAGSGDATIAPQDELHVTILGSGNVYLTSRPARIERTIMGSGKVIERY